jgi:hypothetical protein
MESADDFERLWLSNNAIISKVLYETHPLSSGAKILQSESDIFSNGISTGYTNFSPASAIWAAELS